MGGCGDLLDFEEVRTRLMLGTRKDIGTHEIPIEQVIGSVSRAHEFDGCFRPRTDRLRRLLREIRANRPDAADAPILVYQVDHAYFVVDGHKRLALAVEEGREFIDAEVSWFPSRFHLDAGTTIDEIRLTQLEHAFRRTTGLDVSVPDARFPLSDRDAYLELAESVKAHGYDLSRREGRIVDPVESSRHWYSTVYRPAIELARSAGVARVLTSCSEAELFLVLRRGATEEMAADWRVPATFVERSTNNLRRADRGAVPDAVARLIGRRRRVARVLPDGDAAPTADGDSGARSTRIVRPRRAEEAQPD